MYDFSTAERSQSDVIPAKTQAPIRVSVKGGDVGTPENAFTVTQSGLYMLNLECTVTEGEYAKRKFWPRLVFGVQPGAEATEGQGKAIAIAHSLIRSILEAARGYAPTDESAEAIAARKMDSIFELDGLELWVEIGVEQDKDGKYPAKNKIQKVLPVKAATAAPAVARAPAAGFGGVKPTAPAGNKPAWAK